MGLAHYVITVTWAVWNLGLVLWACLWTADVRHRRRSHRFPVGAGATYSAAADDPPLLTARVRDLSRHGIGMTVSERCAQGDRVRVVLLLDDGPVTLTGVVATAEPAGSAWNVGVALDPLPSAVIDVITSWCFAHPFGREYEVMAAEIVSAAQVPTSSGMRCAVVEQALSRESCGVLTGDLEAAPRRARQ